MKKFILSIAVFTLIQVGIGVAIYQVYPRGVNLYYASSPYKHERLKTAPSPRMIFLGGSGLGFGLDSDRILDQLGYQPVNMGVHGALGTTFMINEVKPHIREGDVVVLCFEHPLLAYHDSSIELQFMIEHRPDGFALLEWAQIQQLLDSSLNYLGGMSRTTVRHLQGKPYRTWIPQFTDRIFNDYGDITIHRTMAQRPITQPMNRLRIDPAYQKKLVKRVNAFHAYCEERGVKVFFFHGPLLRPYYEATQEEITTIDAFIREQFTVPIMNTPEDLVYGPEFFFDTPYHLWGEGITRRTDHIIEGLKDHIPPAP